MKRNVPIITFLSRTYLLLIFTVLLNCLPLWNHAFIWVPNGLDEWGNTVWRGVTAFDLVGSALYIPGIVLLTQWVISLGIHLYFRETLDADAHSGQYVRDWENLSARDRVMFGTILRVGFFVGSALIAAGIAK